jgi:hypothetical protein
MVASIIAVILVFSLMSWCGYLTAKRAAQKGRSRGVWFLLGSLFFPIPSFILARLPTPGQEKGPHAPA